jgi:uncharacterized RDD family membrane protein YckC
MNWFYAIDQQQLGPITQEEFSRLLSDGIIKPETLVWREGLANWLPYSEYAASQPVPLSTAKSAVVTTNNNNNDTAVCAVSGKTYPKREMVQYEGKWISAEHRDAYFQRLREGVTQPSNMIYCGFWIRFCAKLIDIIIGFLLGMVNSAIWSLLIYGSAQFFMAKPPAGSAASKVMLFTGFSGLTGLGIALLYSWFFIYKFQGTPGKIILGMKIVRADGSRLSTGRIIGRYFADWINGFTLYLSYIMVGVDTPEHRGLHDRICDTRVVKR